MTENKNFTYETEILPRNNTIQNQVNINNFNLEQTTEPNSSNIQDIVQKQKKLYDEIITLSTNMNVNNDLNYNNNINTNINNNEDLYQLSGVSNQSQNKQLFQNHSNLNNIHSIKGEQSKKINELINKFNNLIII